MRAERGASLLECQVAIMFLAVAIILILNLLAIGHLAQALARDQNVATNLAQRRLEEIKAGGPDAAVSLPRQAVDDGAYRRFEWEVDVADRPAHLKEVTTTVYWIVRGRERSVRLATYVRGN